MWFEKLPDQCPPAEAIPPTPDKWYRLVSESTVTCKDFWSHRKIWPKKVFSTCECTALSLSIFNNIRDCENVRKLPLHKNKKIAELTLDNTSGVLLQTTKNKSHYSWWRSNSFKLNAQSKVI